MPTFERSIEIAAPIADLYAFHLDTRNAARIASKGQEIVSIEGEFPLVQGAEVILRVRQAPIPTIQTWRVRVTEVVEPTLVVDELIKGPFKRFRHEHRFTELDANRTLLTDRIEWELPGGPAGRLAAPVAARLLEKSFAERQETTKRLLEADARVPA
jgi:ligand-binding SRPBCC domain-containing protein